MNKKIGNDFEQELCEKLSEYGFWAHNLSMNKSGQPADIIAVKNKRPYLIDAKVCSNGTFPLSRVEENQHLAMDLWNECGNGQGWFALQLDTKVYMLSHHLIMAYKEKQSSLSAKEILELGTPLEKWVMICQ